MEPERLPMPMLELTSGPAAEPVEYALVYATCIHAAADLISAAIMRNTHPGKTFNARDVFEDADLFMAQSLKAGREAWDQAAITLTAEPVPMPEDKPLARWKELIEAAEYLVVGRRYGSTWAPSVMYWDRLQDAVLALREETPRVDPS